MKFWNYIRPYLPKILMFIAPLLVAGGGVQTGAVVMGAAPADTSSGLMSFLGIGGGILSAILGWKLSPATRTTILKYADIITNFIGTLKDGDGLKDILKSIVTQWILSLWGGDSPVAQRAVAMLKLGDAVSASGGMLDDLDIPALIPPSPPMAAKR